MPPEVVPYFTLPPIKREIVLNDPVRDPNESWGTWVNRVLEFEKPPLVERNSLPEALQPQNTMTGKLKILLKLENPLPDNQEPMFGENDPRKVIPHLDENISEVSKY